MTQDEIIDDLHSQLAATEDDLARVTGEREEARADLANMTADWAIATAERDRARDLAAALEARLHLTETALQAYTKASRL